MTNSNQDGDIEGLGKHVRGSNGITHRAALTVVLMVVMAALHLQNPKNLESFKDNLSFKSDGLSVSIHEPFIVSSTSPTTTLSAATPPDFSVPLNMSVCTDAQIENANLTLSSLYWTYCPEIPWLYQWLMNTEFKDPVTSICVGCNKGLTAIEVHRMASRQENVDRTAWSNTYLKNLGLESDNGLSNLRGFCGEIRKASMPLAERIPVRPDARTFCIEPVGINFDLLQKTATQLDLPGFYTHRAAISNTTGIISVPNYKKPGLEYKGIANFQEECQARKDCDTNVTVFSLDEYVSKHVNPSGNRPIHFLSAQVIGHSVEVLKGGKETLSNVYYLEFQYSKNPPWPTYSLKETISMLEESYGFVCYFIGNHRAWRINGCWRSLYERHTLGNIGCVNNNHAEARPLLDIFETVSSGLLN
jgi:FkbM family methyltransferase